MPHMQQPARWFCRVKEEKKMTVKSINWPVLNSLIFVNDASNEDIPEIDGIGGLWAIPSCVAVGCLPDADGDTKIILGPVQDVGTEKHLLFEGTVETPTRKLIVDTVLAETLLETDVPKTVTHLKIWTDGYPDSEIVIIGIV